MVGVEQGVDTWLSTRLLRSETISAIERGIPANIIAGATWSCERLWLAGILDSAECPGCKVPRETATHIWVACSHYQQLRDDIDFIMQEEEAGRMLLPAT